MTVERIIAILRARWMAALAVFVVVAGGVAAYTLTREKTFTAVAAVVLDIKNADPIQGMVSPSIASPSYLMTQVDLITSNRVAQRVVRTLKLNASDDMRRRWLADTQGKSISLDSYIGAALRTNLDARPSRGSNVINVSYQASDPRFAATVANAYVQAYLDTVVDLRTLPAKQSKEMFDSSLKAARSALEHAQGQLSSYQQKQSLMVTDERLDVETARLNELSTQYVVSQTAMADSSSRQAAAMSKGEIAPDVLSNPLVSSLRAELIRQQNGLEQITLKLGDQHPQVQEMKAGIADQSRKLEAEIRKVMGSVGVGNSVNTNRSAQLHASLEMQRGKVMKMKVIRDEAAILQRDVDSAQRVYDGLLNRMGNSNLESQATQANVSALEYAEPPPAPSSPRILMSIVVGALIGLVLATALAMLLEHLDHRLRVETEIEALLQQPCVGSIPAFKKRKGVPVNSPVLRVANQPIKALLTRG
jgi:succinoglycan biosynthesis transport protein ExoP